MALFKWRTNDGKEKLVVKADNPVEAVKKLYNNNLQNAIQESYTLSDISEKEADYFRKTATWEDVVDIEKSNNAIKDLGHGYYADEYIERNDNNPHSANQSILKNNDPEHPYPISTVQKFTKASTRPC